jgi:hypothetical protein
MHAEKSDDDDASVKTSPGGTSPESRGLSEVKWPQKSDEDDATVRISPGGPPPKDTKGILRPAQWTLSAGQSLVISIGKGLSLELTLEQGGKGCVIKTQKK